MWANQVETWGGWWGQAIATLPPGGARIGHQGALQEGKGGYFSISQSSVGQLGWDLGGCWGHAIAILPPGGAPIGHCGQLLISQLPVGQMG